MFTYPYPMSTDSVEPVTVDWTNQLPSGATITGANFWLMDPDRDTTPIGSGDITISGVRTTAYVGPLADRGDYTLNCQAECDDGSVLDIQVRLKVAWTPSG